MPAKKVGLLCVEQSAATVPRSWPWLMLPVFLTLLTLMGSRKKIRNPPTIIPGGFLVLLPSIWFFRNSSFSRSADFFETGAIFLKTLSSLTSHFSSYKVELRNEMIFLVISTHQYRRVGIKEYGHISIYLTKKTLA